MFLNITLPLGPFRKFLPNTEVIAITSVYKDLLIQMYY